MILDKTPLLRTHQETLWTQLESRVITESLYIISERLFYADVERRFWNGDRWWALRLWKETSSECLWRWRCQYLQYNYDV